ncbi:alkylhydroperoxidase AhpD family core domain-containing protein [Amycolatopsis arida]|uniref:Alkylhydroperoxidase AhpD family core domain-containing protein n=1 Tax=Amycolatopsis arida TaxID=587909 RepID=A0A1I5MI04_9PSEU|nr:carboxymuconolactone decarboxylase family protein [Amycolatopsis arida]TDX94103.1 AhpD family alkylhydroperoxidase [Amycolatopsis arida]SFP09215.1 alkylhydroperoxidase AhpD family core domain-containing protein [Amycolatopsis arida]
MSLVRLALRGAQTRIRHVGPVRPGAATGVVARVFAQVERDFGMLAPPVSLHAPAPDLLAATWAMLRETLLADGRAGRTAKEVVATAVSRANACPYCVEVHGATLHGLLPPGDTGAVTGDRTGPAADPGVRALAAWAGAEGGAVPFPAERLPELGGVAVTFTYLNRMVNVFLDDSPIPPRAPDRARRYARRLLAFVLRPRPGRVPPGSSLELFAGAVPPLPAELAWAAEHGTVAGALARAAAAAEAAGARSVPPAVRELVATELAGWSGKPPGPSRAWVEDPVATLPAPDRPAGRLALLTAMAAYQVDDGAVARLRDTGADDARLVELTGWASFAAARRVGARIAAATDPGAARG